MKYMRFLFVLVFLIALTSGCNVYDRAVISENQSSAPDFKLSDINGNQFSLSDYKGKKAVLLMFWTTWCPYCRIALRSLKDDREELEGLGIELLTIDVGEPAYKVSNFIKGLGGVGLTVLLDSDTRVSSSYDVLGVPTYFVISRSGMVVFSGNRFSKARLKGLNLE
ncbi:MAG: redoxin domain-containing protein [Candidatus Omnitrophica bacterium]|nr:redoxin domain-containing protein [Candidatus Omnitrophota bacterium]